MWKLYKPQKLLTPPGGEPLQRDAGRCRIPVLPPNAGFPRPTGIAASLLSRDLNEVVFKAQALRPSLS